MFRHVRSKIVLLLILGILFIAYHQLSNREPSFPKTPQDLDRINSLYDSATYSLNDSKATSAQDANEYSIDGVFRYSRATPGASPTILLLVLTKDSTSWGSHPDGRRRVFSHFLSLLDSTLLDPRSISLAILTSSEGEYQHLKTTVGSRPFGRAEIYFHPGYDKAVLMRENRHNRMIQNQRRAEIARLRNYLMLRSLQDEAHIVWLDSDVYELHSPAIIQRMISHAAKPDVGIITARCKFGKMTNYDKNAWAGSRSWPEELKTNPYWPNDNEHRTRRLVDELLKGTSDDDLVHLDAVGATILYIRATLVHQGLAFPHNPVIGTDWGRDGWDGIESEGLCYRARNLIGGSDCWLLGGRWHVRHTDDG